jgi:hypothetical protein
MKMEADKVPEMLCSLSYLEFRTMDKEQISSDPGIYIIVYVVVNDHTLFGGQIY